MRPNHIHLHVRDLERASDFYRNWLGLTDGPRFGEVVFLRSDEGFDLALSLGLNPEPLPAWFHWGFKLASAEAVRVLHSRMESAGVPIVKPLFVDQELALFRCADPDGHQIELYWE